MPTISMFYGIAIRMFFDDHAPPHFHVYYSGHKASYSILTGHCVAGYLPITADKLVKKWFTLHKVELEQNWAHMENGETMERIRGLD